MIMNSKKLNNTNGQRLKKLISAQCLIERREFGIAKRSSTLLKNLEIASETITKHQIKYDRIRNKLEEYNKLIEERHILANFLRTNLAAIKENNTATRSQQKSQLASLAKLSRSLREIEEATQLFINHKALPARLMGVTRLREPNASPCIGFNVASDNVSELTALCGRLHISNTNASTWNQLIFVANKQQIPDSNNKSISIVIDLT